MAPSLVLLVGLLAASSLPAQPLRRSIEPFRVEDARGAPLVNPFGGGLWQPRVALRDVTGNSLPDLLALNPDAELRLYRNEGGWRFRRVLPSPYDSLPLRDWFRLTDLDGDGDDEILTAGPRSEMMLLVNHGSNAAPSFALPPVPVIAATGDTLRTQRETVPALVDIDADGDLDLFTGNLDGSITFHENTGTRTAPALAFRTDRYMDILVTSPLVRSDDGASPEPAALHGASVLDFGDLDGDGDLDMLFGDAFTRKLLLFHNTGSPAAAAFSMSALDTAFRPFGDEVESEGFNQSVVSDADADGDLDVIVSSLSPSTTDRPIALYENIGTNSRPVMRRRDVDLASEFDIGTNAAPAWIEDAERRGLLVGSSSGRINYLAQVSESPLVLRIAGTWTIPGLFQTVPTAGDLDGDGVAELAVGEAFGSVSFYRFTDNRLERFGDTFMVNRNASPQLVDADGDGDLDLIIGAENGRAAFIENAGSATAPRFQRRETPAPFAGRDFGYDAAPRLADLDGDADLDAVVGSRSGGAVSPRDSVRFFLRSPSGFAEDAAWPTLVGASNPVPLILRQPDATVLLLGDIAGGLRAYTGEGNWLGASSPRDEEGTGVRLTEESPSIRVSPSTTEQSVAIFDILGRLVQSQILPPGATVVHLPEGAAGTLVLQLDGRPAFLLRGR